MGEPIIETRDLTKIYGEKVAVDHLSLTIEKGEIFGLLGPNGAGKSTTILMLLGLSEPTSGQVRVCGIDSTREPVKVKKKVGYLPDVVGFYDDLSGMDNLLFTARLNQIEEEAAHRRAEQLLERVGLAAAKKNKVGTYSRGMRQRLGLADVLIKQPEVIILDEPTLGIDPEGVRDLLQLIRQLSRDEGITVLLSSHHLHQVQQICDRVGLFVSGRLLAVGDISALSQQLFGNLPYMVQAKVELLGDNVIEQLSQITGVESIDRTSDWLNISCSRDAAKDISRAIIQSGAELLELRQKQYGLDDIYHRYFEGGI